MRLKKPVPKIVILRRPTSVTIVGSVRHGPARAFTDNQLVWHTFQLGRPRLSFFKQVISELFLVQLCTSLLYCHLLCLVK